MGSTPIFPPLTNTHIVGTSNDPPPAMSIQPLLHLSSAPILYSSSTPVLNSPSTPTLPASSTPVSHTMLIQPLLSSASVDESTTPTLPTSSTPVSHTTLTQLLLSSTSVNESTTPISSDISGKNQASGAVATSVTIVNTSTGSDVPPQDPVSNSQPVPLSHQSHHTIILSTCTEKMNKIGMTVDTNKENKKVPEPTIDGMPNWAYRAHSYLTTCNLGPEWQGCVRVWLQLEEKLKYGGATKVVLTPIATVWF